MASTNTQTFPHVETYWTGAVRRPVPQERRSRVRFPIDLPFSYRTLDRTLRTGVGRILNISSSGVLAACSDRLTVDTTVEITIEWPARMERGIPLHLTMTGSIVRCEMFRFAVVATQLRLRPAPLAEDVFFRLQAAEESAEEAATNMAALPGESMSHDFAARGHLSGNGPMSP